MRNAPTARSSASLKDWIPRQPRHILIGHREEITAVTFHPIVSTLATCSADSTIKLWDWETGDIEKTLKGHTRLVSDVDFDSKGNLLGAFCVLSSKSCLTVHTVSGGNDLAIKIWDSTADYKNTKTLHGHDHSVSSVK